MRITQQVGTVGSARWIRRARQLAARIKKKVGVRREIHDGYIVEGKKTGAARVARVLDLDPYLLSVGPGPFFPEGPDGVVVQLTVCSTEFPRDALHWDWHPTPLPVSKVCTRAHTFKRAQLKRRGAADTEAYYNAMLHGSVVAVDGLVTEARSITVPMAGSGSSQDRITPYKTDATPTFYDFVFSTYVGIPNSQMRDGVLVSRIRLSQCRGLTVDSAWLDENVGAGLQVVMDWWEGGVLSSASGRGGTQWSEDSFGLRYQYPWAVASPWQITQESITWQLGVRLTTPPDGDNDVWGHRQLAALRVASTPTQAEDGEITPHAQVLGVTDRYDPLTSDDPRRRPLHDGTRWERNSFAAPVVAPRGAMVIPHVVRNDATGPTADHYHAVLLTTAGQFVELPLPVDAGRSVGWFAGGDEVDGVVYLVNPFLYGSRLALVNGETGDVQILPRPAWEAPLAGVDSWPGRYSEDVLRGTVAHVGLGRLGFPVEVGGVIWYAELDTTTGVSQLVGTMWSPPSADMRGGLSQVGVVQAASEDRPAILLAGYNLGAAPGRIATGWMFVSYDGGVTWSAISNFYGPARAVSVIGNGLFYPKPGELWGGT